MRKWITLLMTLVGSTVSYANATTGQVNLEGGYRRDNISWRHRFPSDDPVFSSNTKFKDVDIFQLALNGRMTVGSNLYVRANAYWGWILDGTFKQKGTTFFNPFEGGYEEGFDFALNRDRRNVIDDKYVYGVSAAVGYPFYFCDCTTSVAPIIGYAVDEQNIHIEDQGFRLSRFDESNYGNGSADFLFPVNGSDSSRRKFISKWYGPFAGLDFNFRPYSECWNFYAQVEYHWGNFKGRRHSTGFNFFDDRDHRSNDVRGWVFAFGADYDLCNCWTVGFSLKFQDWVAHRHHRDDGSSDFGGFLFDGSSGRRKTTDKWNSYAINLTVGRAF
jgi:hypothetical protein